MLPTILNSLLNIPYANQNYLTILQFIRSYTSTLPIFHPKLSVVYCHFGKLGRKTFRKGTKKTWQNLSARFF